MSQLGVTLNYAFGATSSHVVNFVVLERLEAITNPVERFAFFRANRAEIITEFQQRQLAEKQDTRTNIERWLAQGVANAGETAEVLRLSAAMLSQVRQWRTVLERRERTTAEITNKINVMTLSDNNELAEFEAGRAQRMIDRARRMSTILSLQVADGQDGSG
jgi:hypothetical protein